MAIPSLARRSFQCRWRSLQIAVACVCCGIIPQLVLGGPGFNPQAAALAAPQTQPQSGRTPAFRDRVVDLILLRDGSRLSGVPVPGASHEFLFRTDWLKSEAPAVYEQTIAAARPDQLQAAGNDPANNTDPLASLVAQEIQRLKTAGDADARRTGLLQEYLDRRQPMADQPPELVQLEIPAALIRRHQPQSPQHQQLGLLALLNHLPRPETTAARQIMEQLEAIPAAQQVREFPTAAAVNAVEQLETLLAAIDVRCGNCSSYVDTGNRLIAQDQPVDVQQLLAQMLTDQFQQQLTDLLSEDFGKPVHAPLAGMPLGSGRPDLPLDVQQAVAAKGHTTVVVAGFALQPAQGTAVVQKRLYHRNHQQQWRLVVQAAAQASHRDLTAEQQAAVAADPQVQQLSGLVQGLGLDATQLQVAVRSGTVVKIASNRCEVAFQDQLAAILSGQPSAARPAAIPRLRLALAAPPLPAP